MNFDKYLPKLAPDGDSSGPEMDQPEGLRDIDILNQGDEDVSDEEKDEDEEEGEEGDISDEEEESDGRRKSRKVKGSDDKDDVDEDEEDQNTEDEEDDEEDEESDDDSTSDDEDEEDVDSKTLYKSLKKNYKDIFEKFPQLKEAIQTSNEYAEVFPSVEVAKVASKKSEIFDAMQHDINSENPKDTKRFVDALFKIDKGGAENFAHNFLDTIGEINPDLYGEVLRTPIKKALLTLYHSGQKFKNKNMMGAAIYAHEFFFDTQEILKPLEETRKKAEKSKEQLDWEKEKETHSQQVFNSFTNSITEVIQHSLSNKVKKAIEDYKLDSYTSRNLIRDVVRKVDGILSGDKRHLSGMDSLFNQAKSSGLNNEWKTRIIKAYLTRSGQSMPSILRDTLKEAGIKVREVKKDGARRLVPAGLGSGNKEEIDFSKVDKSKTTDADILSGDPKRIKYKK